LVNLLPRFYELTSGSIRIDGVDISGVTIKSLREQIAMVTQENILFHDTVWNNISYGLNNISEERVIDAAKAALAHDFIMELPQQYHTLIGERGTRLSGRSAPAHCQLPAAILKNSPILILDEATSELDAESEMNVQRASRQSHGRPHHVRHKRTVSLPFAARTLFSCWKTARSANAAPTPS